MYPVVLVRVTPIWNGDDVRSDKPSGADNQQGSPSRRPYGVDVTPQRLHAELLAVGAKGLEASSQVKRNQINTRMKI